jgi:hypothetical protein
MIAVMANNIAERKCGCGAPADNTKGKPSCGDCKRDAALARNAAARAARAATAAGRPCKHCGEPVGPNPADQGSHGHVACREAYSVAKAAAREEARAVALAGRRKCHKCGATENLTGTGVPVCADCRSYGKLKQRDCKECGAGFNTRNNTTLCSPCKYKRVRARTDKECPRCGAAIDARAAHCSRCAPRGYSTARSIGDRYVHPKSGYVDVKTERGWLKEHIVVMEQRLGRTLLAGENVHHINGVRDDNRIENLELWAKTQPAGARARDLLKWAREIVDRYEGEDI